MAEQRDFYEVLGVERGAGARVQHRGVDRHVATGGQVYPTRAAVDDAVDDDVAVARGRAERAAADAARGDVAARVDGDGLVAGHQRGARGHRRRAVGGGHADRAVVGDHRVVQGDVA